MEKQPLIRAMSAAVTLSLMMPALAHQTTQTGPGRRSAATELEKIYEEDQHDHSDADSLSRYKRKERVLQLLSHHKVRTGEDYYDAGMVYQHSLTPRDLLFAHILAVSSARQGNKQGIWLAAASLDRYLQSIKQPQVFGTQLGSSQEPYDKSLVSDDLRAEWCVAPISEQMKILAEVTAGKPFRSTRLCQ